MALFSKRRVGGGGGEGGREELVEGEGNSGLGN